MNRTAMAVRTALFVLLGGAALVGAVLVFAHVHRGADARLVVRFHHVGGLREGAPVKVGGVEVGRVEEVTLVRMDGGGEVRVTLGVPKNVASAVCKGTRFLIETENMIGEKYVEVVQPRKCAGTAPAELWGEDPPRLDELMAKATRIVDTTERLLSSNEKEIGSLIRSSSRLMEASADFLEKNEGDIKKLMEHTDALLSRTERLLDTALVAVGDGRSLRRTLGHTESILATVDNQLPGLLTETRNSLKLLKKFEKLLTRQDVDRLFATLDRVDRILDKTLQLMDKTGAMMDMALQGKGTVGALMVKRTVYEDLKELVRDLRENPWKLFWKD